MTSGTHIDAGRACVIVNGCGALFNLALGYPLTATVPRLRIVGC